MVYRALFGLAAASTALLCANPARAQEYYTGQIMIAGFTWCPAGSLEADGSLLQVTQYPVLFALYGTAFGGDGTTTFGLPNLGGRVPINWGAAPGLTPYAMGQAGGSAAVALGVDTLAAHSHVAVMRGFDGTPTTDDPAGASPADFPDTLKIYAVDAPRNATMAAGGATMLPAGRGRPFPTISPFVALRFCVFTEGVSPPHDG